MESMLQQTPVLMGLSANATDPGAGSLVLLFLIVGGCGLPLLVIFIGERWVEEVRNRSNMEAARDAHSDREAAESELRYYHAKTSPVPQHVRDTLAVIAPDVDPDLPDEDD